MTVGPVTVVVTTIVDSGAHVVRHHSCPVCGYTAPGTICVDMIVTAVVGGVT